MKKANAKKQLSIQQLKPEAMQRALPQRPGLEWVGVYVVNQWLQVVVGRESGRLHVDLSHPRRYPTWEEVREIRYALLPKDTTFGLLFPPLAEFSDRQNALHLVEITELKETEPSTLILPPGYDK